MGTIKLLYGIDIPDVSDKTKTAINNDDIIKFLKMKGFSNVE
jgi:hypothetical protein